MLCLLLHLKRQILQPAVALDLQNHGVSRFEVTNRGAQRLHRIDGFGVERVDDVPGLQTAVGHNKIRGSAYNNYAAGNSCCADNGT